MIWSNFGRRFVALANSSAGRSALELGTAATSDTGDFVASGTVREVLTANRTYYVRTDGSDSNTGLTDSAGGAFLTIQAALDTIAENIDFGGYTITVDIADGTYTGAISVPRCVGQAQASDLLLSGNSANPENVIISVAGHAITFGVPGAMARLTNFEIRTSSGNGVNVTANGAYCEIHTGMRLGAISATMIAVNQGRAKATGNYSIVGNAARRVWAKENGVYIEEFRTITYSGTPAFSSVNVDNLNGHVSSAAATQSGAATGKRYAVTANGVTSTGGGGASYYPGDVAGTASTGGQYS